jgi:hypothetical protein
VQLEHIQSSFSSPLSIQARLKNLFNGQGKSKKKLEITHHMGTGGVGGVGGGLFPGNLSLKNQFRSRGCFTSLNKSSRASEASKGCLSKMKIKKVPVFVCMWQLSHP